MQFLPFHFLLLLRIVAGEIASKTPPSPIKPVALPNWATGWEIGGDPQAKAKTQKLVQIAREREQEATKALEEAKARERRAGMREAEVERALEQIRAQGGSVANATITKIHVASTAAVKSAEQEAAKARQRAENADRAFDAHLARAKQQLAAMKSPAELEQASSEVIAALTAEDVVTGSSSVDAVSMATLAAPNEAVDAYTRLLQQLILLAERARATGTVPELQAQLASEQVNVVKLQSLRGSDIGGMSNDTERFTYVALGGFAVGIFGLVYSFAFRRQESDTKGLLQEPLLVSSPYTEPEWTKADDTEATIDDWRQRAVDAQQGLQRAKTALSEAEAVKSSDREQLTIAQQHVKELETRESETRQREENDARRQAETQAQMDRLRERLELAETAVKRSDQESQSAQAAAQESQMRALEALSRVDLDAEEQKTRADDLEGKLKEIQEAEAQLKSAQEAHQANFDQAQAQLRETKRELEEATAAVDEAKKTAAEVDVQRSNAEDQLEQQLLLNRQKSKETRSLVEERQIQVQQVQEENDKLSVEIEKITTERSHLKQELEATSQQGKESEGQRQQLQEEMQRLAEQIKNSAHEQKRLQREVEESQGLVAQQGEQLETAKNAAKDAAQALEAVRQQASAEITTGKKVAAELQAEKDQLQEALEQAQADVEVETARANHAEQLSKSRHMDLEHAQQLTEKAKAQLQTVRQELSAECAAAKAQVDVERKLACEAEELAEKSRLDTQTARNAEQEARLAEQEAKAAVTKLQKGSTSPRGEKELQASASAAADRWRKEIAAAQAETQEFRAAERRLKDELDAASARDSQMQEVLAQSKGELANMRALYAEATAAKTLAEQDLVQACGEATAAKEALKSMQGAGELSKAVGS